MYFLFFWVLQIKFACLTMLPVVGKLLLLWLPQTLLFNFWPLFGNKFSANIFFSQFSTSLPYALPQPLRLVPLGFIHLPFNLEIDNECLVWPVASPQYRSKAKIIFAAVDFLWLRTIAEELFNGNK